MHICIYCGREAKYQFKNGEWCCSKSFNQCPENRRKNSKSNKDPSEETRRKISEALREAHKNPNNGYHSTLYKEKLSKTKKGKNNPMYGKESWSKGKTGIFSKEVLKKMSEGNKKQIPWNKGKKGVQVSWNKGRTGVYSKKVLKKMRIAAIKNIENRCGQISPAYNPSACKLINKYGNNYNFQHAENGGEYRIKELGYWVDGYDKDKNVVIEVDESFHFDCNGDLKEKDVQRQKEIEEHLNCEFIRVKI